MVDLPHCADASYGVTVRTLPASLQSEQVDFEIVWLLADPIAADGHWRKPIVVEGTQGI